MAKKLYIRIFALVLIAILTLGLFASASLANENPTSVKTKEKTAVYSGMGKEHSTLLTLKKGAEVMLLDANADAVWARVIANKKEGFVEKALLGIPSSMLKLFEPGVITKTVKMYDTTGAGAKSLYTLQPGAAVTVLSASGDNWEISYNQSVGYVSSASVKLSAPEVKAAEKTEEKTAAKAVLNQAIADKIAKAKQKNRDTVGWISVPNSNIDYPILYAPNFYYAYRDIDKKKSNEGVYPMSNRDSKNVVLFGHNLRKSGTGFHYMHHLEEAARGYTQCQHSGCKKQFDSKLKNWWKTKEGRTWDISIFGYQKWEIYAMYEVPKNEPSKTLRNAWALNPGNMDAWIKGQIERSKSYMGFDFGVEVSAKDKVMTIITCGTNYDSATANSRLFVFLKNVG